MPQKFFSVTLDKSGGPLGMKLGYNNGKIVITRFQDVDDKGSKGPAESCGMLEPGDELLSIQGINIKGFLFTQIIAMIQENDILTFRFSRQVKPGILNLLSNHPVPPATRKRLRQLGVKYSIKRVFEAFDVDSNGTLSPSELANTPFKSLHEGLLDSIDINADGLIGEDEWVAAWTSLQQKVGSLAVQNMLIRLIYHCEIDVEDELKRVGESMNDDLNNENETEIENVMNRSIENIMKLKALEHSQLSSQSKNTNTESSMANIFSIDTNKKPELVKEMRINALKEAGRVDTLKELFDLWDFDGNGFLDLLEIKAVMYHLKNSMVSKPILYCMHLAFGLYA